MGLDPKPQTLNLGGGDGAVLTGAIARGTSRRGACEGVYVGGAACGGRCPIDHKHSSLMMMF